MKERPILFSALMVKAILEGSKTQTRRVVNGHIGKMLVRGELDGDCIAPSECPYGQPGDRLWVRETWAWIGDHRFQDHRSIVWRATDGERHTPLDKWRPSIHMPRWASRLTLEIINVRVEQVREISEQDAKREGVTPSEAGRDLDHLRYRAGFQTLWDSINGQRPGCSWADNPWVWVVEFRRD